MTAQADALMGIFGFKRVEKEMKTDRELLELAGRAIGYRWDAKGYEGSGNWWNGESWLCDDWNPLTDDGDALRLAVRLGFTVEPGKCWHSFYGPAFGEDVLDGEMTATRRAIVRAAAAIGEQMQ